MVSTAGRNPVVAPAAAPTPTPTPPDRPPVAGAQTRRFAELLQQNRLAESRRASADADTRASAGAGTAAPATAPGHDGPATNVPAAVAAPSRDEAIQAKARNAAAKAPPGAGREPRTTGADAGAARAEHEEPSQATAADAAAPSVPNGAAPRPEPMVGAAKHLAGVAGSAGVDGATDGLSRRDVALADGGAAGDSGAAASGRSARGQARAEAATHADGATARDARRGADGDAGERRIAFADALAERRDALPPVRGAAEPGAAGSLFPMPAPAASPGAPSPEPGAVAAAALPTPVDAPEFAAAVGVQVSVFARDGVQQAQLHLNPAEMGPVSITITLDGTQARVDFGADVAATRQALENGLPELAGALRDAGFTLSGGGVSAHADGRGGSGSGRGEGAAERGDAAARQPSAPGPGAAAVRTSRRVAAGGVDLYA